MLYLDIYVRFSSGMTMPEVVSMSVTSAEFLLCLGSCCSSADPAVARPDPGRSLSVFIQKKQFFTESRKCWDIII